MLFVAKDGEMMHKNDKFGLIVISILLIAVLAAGCKKGGNTTNGREVGGISVTTKETTTEYVRYSATNQAIIVSIDLTKQEVTFINVGGIDKYTLTYNGGTKIRSKNGTELTMAQMEAGQIVDIYYVGGTQRLMEMCESSTAWKNDSVVKWKVDYDKKRITIGSNSYKYDDSLLINSNGQKITIDKVSDVDELVVRGVENQIYSVVVSKGHGYVRLVDDTNMVGGIIEIGNKIMTLITEDMVLVAPEGAYTLTATKNGKGGSKEINIIRDEELIVSLSEFQQEATRYGSIKFSITPEDAQAIMYIDGESVDYSDLVELPYGKHTIKLTSNNYDTYQKTITVASIYSTISIDMKEEETTTTKEEETTTTKNGQSETTVSTRTGTYNSKVFIVAPSGATVYVDGVSKGISPVSFSKVEGSHTILLMKNGYKSKVYTINLDNTKEDVILSYPDMVKTDE